MRAFPSLAIGIQIGILSSMNGTVFYSATRRIWIARYPAGLHGTPKIIAGYGKTREKAIRNRERALGRAIAGNQYHHGEQAHTTAKYMQLYFDELNAGDDAQAFGAFMDSPAYDRQAEAAHQAWKAADEDIQRA